MQILVAARHDLCSPMPLPTVPKVPKVPKVPCDFCQECQKYQKYHGWHFDILVLLGVTDPLAEFRRTFTCSTCRAGMARSLSRPGDADQPVVSFKKTRVNNVNVSMNVPRTTNKYEIMIGESNKGGDIVSDGCGYTYGFHRDYVL